MYLFIYEFCFFSNLPLSFIFSGTLLAELREYNLEQQRRVQADSNSPDGPPEDSSISARLKGKMTSRSASDDSVIIRLSVMLSTYARHKLPNHC